MAPKSTATQNFVPLKEVRDGFAVLKDGSLRSLLMCSSLNFALKSEEEQNSILFQFQSFLNSLDFSIQIFIQSRKLDIRPYIALLEARYKEQVSDLMKIQIQEYIQFIKSFTESTNIMTKTFFVIVPYSPAILQSKTTGGTLGKIGQLNPLKKNEENEQAKIAAFEEKRSQLEERLAVVEQGLTRCGIRTVRLGTEEIVELFYKIFNPGDTEKPLQSA
jgi:hypothetical protein